MFPLKESLRQFLPKVFKTMLTVRCSVDCTEFKVEVSSKVTHTLPTNIPILKKIHMELNAIDIEFSTQFSRV